MNISPDGWMFIILAVLLILATIVFAIIVMRKYPPESVFPPDPMSDSDVLRAIVGSVDDDDD